MDDNKRFITEEDENGVRYYFDQGNGGSGGRPAPNGNKPKKSKIARNIAIVIAIVLVLTIVVSMFGSSSADYISLPSSPYIATLYVEGTIQESNTDYLGRASGYQHAWTLAAIDELMDDENNRGLIIFVDSPGGTVYESDELYLKIKEYQDCTKNPVYAVMGSMAASGGYYISAPCDKIYANRNTWTGSIGVTVGTIVDVSGFLEKYGVKTKTITSGAYKAMGSSYQEMTPEEEAIWRSLVDEAYEQFVGIVADGRGMSTDEVKKVADGRILTAKQAINAGLVDEIGGISEAYDSMCEEYCGGESPELTDIVYTDDSSSLSLLLGSIASGVQNLAGTGTGDASAITGILSDINTHPVSYICEALDY